MKNRGRELAETHWNSYVRPLLEVHGVDDDVIKVCGFHYVSAGEHLYKHGWEDAKNADREV